LWGKVAVLKDYRSLELIANGARKVHQLRFNQDKGHLNSWKSFLSALQADSIPPIPYSHIVGVTAAAFASVKSLEESQPIRILD